MLGHAAIWSALLAREKAHSRRGAVSAQIVRNGKQMSRRQDETKSDRLVDPSLRTHCVTVVSRTRRTAAAKTYA